MFDKYSIVEYEGPFREFREQLEDYDRFIRSSLLPRAREDFRLPQEYYQHRLKTKGVDIPVDERVKIDDLTHDEMTWRLVVHEGCPGHGMQFSMLVEKGISQARAIYAANNVNIEGWALYMEADPA